MLPLEACVLSSRTGLSRRGRPEAARRGASRVPPVLQGVGSKGEEDQVSFLEFSKGRRLKGLVSGDTLGILHAFSCLASLLPCGGRMGKSSKAWIPGWQGKRVTGGVLSTMLHRGGVPAGCRFRNACRNFSPNKGNIVEEESRRTNYCC